jgi:hypothetical protein
MFAAILNLDLLLRSDSRTPSFGNIELLVVKVLL